MAVLNLTPDSFYEGSRIENEKQLLQRAEVCLRAGVRLLDIGGYSSRPGAEDISVEEEIRRIETPVRLLHRHFPEAILSVDTFRVAVAETALVEGAAIINDISAGELDKDMLPFVAKHKVPYVLMHMRGSPQDMAQHNQYEDILSEVFAFLHKKLQWLRAAGCSDLIVDPGLGFAKTVEQNFLLLRHLSFFKHLGAPLLLGLSRKSMIYKPLGCTPKEALPGTSALHMYALTQGACILRVHDAVAAQQVITLYESLRT